MQYFTLNISNDYRENSGFRLPSEYWKDYPNKSRQGKVVYAYEHTISAGTSPSSSRCLVHSQMALS